MTAQATAPETGVWPSGSTGRGGHDWHSVQYVRQWVEENEARLEARKPQFELLASFIPHPREQAIRILDIGAGWGPVTRHLLEVFPQATATLYDYSDVMFDEARRMLAAYAARIRFVKGDLAQPDALAPALADGGPYDALVSSSCIHNVRPTERIPALYQEIRRATAPGGCFLNLDMVGSDSPLLQEVWQRARIERLRRQRLEETGTLPAVEEILAELQAQREAARAARASQHGHSGLSAAGERGGGEPTARTSGGSSRSLYLHLTWLRDAGFDGVECFWRQENRALLGGYVRR